MKKVLTTLMISAFLMMRLSLLAGEGMWLPILLQSLNEKEMQKMGMRITAEDIYSANHSSLKDAIVIFGRGCTGELVSDQGLLLTNHHCGYGQIQKHSSVEHDYLTDGFWAMNRSEELPNPGLTATFLVRMEDVTKKALADVTDEMNENDRYEKIKENIEGIKEEATKETHYEAVVKPFYSGNKYYLFVNEVFKDVRLVGAPPSNIGKFGGDTDNWMWPRHTGDFSVFRIYANKDNQPAEFSEDNVPYKPKKYLEVSLEGVDKGDFSFVFGYPGSTEQYIPSYAVSHTTQITNPVRIDLRGKRLDVMNKYMEKDPAVRIKYAAKYAGVANGWKKWQGENRGIKRLNAIDKKQKYEKEFEKWADANADRKAKYGELIPDFEKTYKQYSDLDLAYTYLAEAGLFGIEIMRYARSFSALVRACEKKDADEAKIKELVENLNKSAKGYFKDYHQAIDREVTAVMLHKMATELPAKWQPESLIEINKKYKGDFEAYADKLFSKSIFASEEKAEDFLKSFKKSKYKKILKDPAYQLANSFVDFFLESIRPGLAATGDRLDSLQRIYMKAQMEMEPDRRFYPDANFTLRVTYGNVDGYQPRDAVNYRHFTTLEGIMEKENPDIYDYVVEDKLKELYENKDYGRYADDDGKMHVGFIATNHTSGGNSGSPVLNADGRLIGLNFDRNWEGTMSDMMYDPDQCRNITLDVRYCLFIIDKFAGAGHLVEEMKIVE
jgi:hypothetical protein